MSPTPLPDDDHLMASPEIARTLKMPDATIREWLRKGVFGEPDVDPGTGKGKRWKWAKIRKVAHEKKIVDAMGRVRTDKLPKRGRHLPPEAFKPVPAGNPLLFVPQVAVMFGVKPETVHHWEREREDQKARGVGPLYEPFPLPEQPLWEDWAPRYRFRQLRIWGIDTKRLHPETGEPTPRRQGAAFGTEKKRGPMPGSRTGIKIGPRRPRNTP